MPATSSGPPKNEAASCLQEAASLWKQRRIAIDAPYFTLNDLEQLDHRINTQLDTLRRDSPQSWTLLEQRLNGPTYSLDDLFPAAALAFTETALPAARDFLLTLIDTAEPAIVALIDTLGWLPLDAIRDSLLQLLQSSDPLHRRIAIAASAHHRADVGDYLTAAMRDADPALHAGAFKAAGELGRLDLLPALRQHLTAPSPDGRLWAAWSAVSLGERGPALETLQALALTDLPQRQPALLLIPRAANDVQRLIWLNTLQEAAVPPRDLITSIGAAGDPWQIPRLIEAMADPEHARGAGEAFTLITGLDLPEHGLARPTDPPADRKNPMRGLPWPNPDAIAAWWQTHQADYSRNTRYLLGRPVTPDHCLHVLIHGYQRQRTAAALDLTLIQTGMPLFALHAPAAEQQDLLDVKNTLAETFATAARLWLDRDRAARAPMTTLETLTELDGRVEQQLTLLREAGDLGWTCCWDQLTARPQPGAVFVAAATAISHPDDAPFQQLTDHVSTAPDRARELIAALGWVAPDRLRGRVRDLLASPFPLLRHVGLATCVLHHVDPGPALDAALKDSGLRLRARALRAVGELRLPRYLPVLRQHLTHANETWRFWAAWSAGLLADPNALSVLQQLVERSADPALQQRGIELLARAMDHKAARLWIRQLLLEERFAPLVIHGLGVLGDASAIPWLIRRMNDAGEQAGQAGAAFSLITGVDLAEQGLVTSAMDLENEANPTVPPPLPRPDSTAINQWWSQHAQRYKKTRCYLNGFPIGVEVCWQALLHGRQHQRAAAALELAILEPQTALFPVEAPGFRQWEWLSAVDTIVAPIDDARSTIPRLSDSRASPAIQEQALDSLKRRSGMELLTMPYPAHSPKPPLEPATDPALASAREALAELTRPIGRSSLFRRRALCAAASAESAARDLQAAIQSDERTIPLPKPTSAAILTARHALVARNKPKLDDRRSRAARPTVNPQPDDAPTATGAESPSNRSPIILSPLTFEWYFNQIAEIWQMRHALAGGRHSSFDQIYEIDRYLKTYLEHLPQTAHDFWHGIETLPAGKGQPGHLFAAAVMALKSHQIRYLHQTVNLALANPRLAQGFISAFGWIPPEPAKNRVHHLLNSPLAQWRRLGMNIAIGNHVDCESFLEKLIYDKDPNLGVLALKAMGKLGYGNLMPLLRQNLRSHHQDRRFWAAWSAVLLGNREQPLEILKGFTRTPLLLRQQQALQLILRVADYRDVERWATTMARCNQRLHAPMVNTGACHQIAWVPWLIERMRLPEQAGFAAEAFTLLTGVDLLDEGLMYPRMMHSSHNPRSRFTEPTQLLAPDPTAIQAWWTANQDRYPQDKRYLLGQEITLAHCKQILQVGRQYQRTAAAVELSLLRAEFPLLEIQASSFQQKAWINALK